MIVNKHAYTFKFIKGFYVNLQCILNTAFIMSICRNAIVAITTENHVRGGGRFFPIQQIQIIICLQQVIVEAIAIKV